MTLVSGDGKFAPYPVTVLCLVSGYRASAELPDRRGTYRPSLRTLFPRRQFSWPNTVFAQRCRSATRLITCKKRQQQRSFDDVGAYRPASENALPSYSASTCASPWASWPTVTLRTW